MNIHTYIHTYIHAYDDEEYAILTALLRQAGMAVYMEQRLNEILTGWFAAPADLCIVAPEAGQSVEAIVRIRVITPVPVVIIIPSETTVETEIALFEAGADLVLKRPYVVRTLVPQVRNLAQRGRSIPLTQLRKSQIGGWLVDPTVRMVQRPDEIQTTLSQREFELFFLLYSHQGQTLTKTQLIEAVWGYTGYGDENALRTLVKQVRHKIEPTPEHPEYLLSVQGVGYQFYLGSTHF